NEPPFSFTNHRQPASTLFPYTTLFRSTGDSERFQKAARYILQHQNEDGGWPIYAGGPSNVSASVKAYFGLKLAGFTADHSALVRSEEHTSELQSLRHLVCRLLLEKKKI